MANAETPHQDAAAQPEHATHRPDQASPTHIYTAISRYPFSSDAEYQSGLAAILGHPSTPATEEEVAQQRELVLQVQCFYFARKYNTPPVEPAGYAAWLSAQGGEQVVESGGEAQTSGDTASAASAGAADAIAPTPTPTQTQASSISSAPETVTQTQASAPAAQAASDEPPPYPNSFAAIVDLITRNIPVPGIEEIPTTVLEHGSSKVDKTPRRRKPWEKDDDDGGGDTKEDGQAASAIGDDVSGAATTAVAAKSGADVIDINGHRETGTGVVNILKPNAVPDSGLLSKD